MDKIDIKSLYFNELSKNIEDLGLPKFRAGQIFKWLQSGVESFDEMTNIPVDLRQNSQKVTIL